MRKKDRTYGQAKTAAYRILAYRDRTSHEIEIKLRDKGFSDAVVSTVVTDLQTVGILDDHRFAKQWIQYQIENRHLGPARLRRSLIEKGFSSSEVSDLLGNLPAAWDPVALANRALLKRYKDVSLLRDLKLRRKAFAFLQRKGFKAENILTVFRNADVI